MEKPEALCTEEGDSLLLDETHTNTPKDRRTP